MSNTFSHDRTVEMLMVEPYPTPSRDRYSDHPPAPPVDDRLDQARKVQQVSPSSGIRDRMS